MVTAPATWANWFPYDSPREIQAEALDILFREWNNYDVFVVSAPTAFGKTALARTLCNAFHSVSVITPANMLVDQYLEEFPDTRTLRRIDRYRCDEWQRPCSVTRGKLKSFCKGCECSSDLATAKFRKGPGIYNYHTYLSHKLYRKVLVVDEAHNLIPVIRDRMAVKMWQHDYRYPGNMFRPEQMKAWVETLSKSKQRTKKVEALYEAVSHRNPRYVVQRTKESFSGKGTVRGEPEDRDLLKLLPVDITDAPPIFWPREVEKVVLLSATISRKDVEQLGLAASRGGPGGRRRVCYIDCASPIPPEARPIIVHNVATVNRNNMENVVPDLAEHIRYLAQHHAGEKGVVHATYHLASLLRPLLGNDDRFMFHDRGNKARQYTAFRESPPGDGRVLIACGMYEGIDLPEDLGRWQVIAKVPWASLGNPAVAHLARIDGELYVWETVKTVIQACGRICRTPEDFGITYILDGSFWRMYHGGKHLIPQWFRDAVDIGLK